MYGSRELTWTRRGDRWVLRLWGKGKVLAEVVSDSFHPGMWRVKEGDTLSDMVNLTRAKDAGVSIVAAKLNREYAAR